MSGSCIGNGFFLSAVVILQISGERSGAAGAGRWHLGSVAASMSRATRAFHDCGEKNAHDDCVVNNSDNASAMIDHFPGSFKEEAPLFNSATPRICPTLLRKP